MKKILEWFKQNLSNPQVVYLVLFLAALTFGVLFLGKFLGPVIAAFILAYLMEGPIGKLVKYLRVRRIFAVFMVFGVFLLAFLTLLFVLLPFVSREIADVAADVPRWPAKISAQMERIPDKYPAYTNQISMVSDLVEGDWLRKSVQSTPKAIADIVPAASKKILTILIYAVIVPLLVLYFLKDKEKITAWFTSFLPADQDRSLAKQVWSDVDKQTANYIRGKFLEIVIVWSVSYVTFRFIGLQYSMVLSLFTGLSVLLPYVGATVMFIPVAIVAITQPGLPVHPGWVILAYGIIQLLDGNVLAPLLLSEVTNLHPIAIIAAILLFGGIWGFWGVFFAIPLATLVNAVITAWPTRRNLARAQNAPEKAMGKRQWASAVSAIFAFVAIMVLFNYKGRPKKIDPKNPDQPVVLVPKPLPPPGPVVVEVERGVWYRVDGKLLSFAQLENELSLLQTAAIERELKVRRGLTVKPDDMLDVIDAVSNAGFLEYKIENTEDKTPPDTDDPDEKDDPGPVSDDDGP